MKKTGVEDDAQMAIAAILVATCSLAKAQAVRPLPTVTPAIDGAFQSHDLVGLGDKHRLAE